MHSVSISDGLPFFTMEEQSIFIKTFGDYPLIKILDFLIYSRDFDYQITEIAKNANVNFQTLKKIWSQMERNQTVISTRTRGGNVLYKININNPVIKKIIELNNFLCWKDVEQKEKKQKITA